MGVEPMTRQGEFRIAVLSGKGGTGKTFAAVNLAVTAGIAAREAGKPASPVRYVDCDVEEPNGHLFLKPEHLQTRTVDVMVPAYDAEACTGCRICTRFCRFHALAFVQNRVRVFPELCHGCNGCVRFCQAGALLEDNRPVGVVERGEAEDVVVLTGRLNPGEATGVPVIHALMRALEPHDADVDAPAGELLTLLDSPPGSGCQVMECIRESDWCVLVAEPTPFGLHDLGMVAELVRRLGKRAGLLFNRCTDDSIALAEQTSAREGMPLLGILPFEADVAGMLAGGGIPARLDDNWRLRFQAVWAAIRKEAGR